MTFVTVREGYRGYVLREDLLMRLPRSVPVETGCEVDAKGLAGTKARIT
ncbi:hypothetical protein M673_05030 [Aureimonas sp. AU20]|nr:hypothetical protein M673_05030 [Aureimonas sp. AU20]